MSDREALAFALAHIDQHITFGDAPGSPSLRVAVDAARERLAQLPEKCEHGWSVPHTPKPVRVAGGVSADEWCPGKVYPAETVELYAAAIFNADFADVSWEAVKQEYAEDGADFESDHAFYYRAAVAVLDALGETE